MPVYPQLSSHRTLPNHTYPNSPTRMQAFLYHDSMPFATFLPFPCFPALLPCTSCLYMVFLLLLVPAVLLVVNSVPTPLPFPFPFPSPSLLPLQLALLETW